MKPRLFKHLKSGNLYMKLQTAINKSAEHEGASVVIYTDGRKLYTRDEEEFHQKFKEE